MLKLGFWGLWGLGRPSTKEYETQDKALKLCHESEKIIAKLFNLNSDSTKIEIAFGYFLRRTENTVI